MSQHLKFVEDINQLGVKTRVDQLKVKMFERRRHDLDWLICKNWNLTFFLCCIQCFLHYTKQNIS